MNKRVLKVHPNDNVIVVLSDIKAGEIINFEGEEYLIKYDIAAKHKFAQQDFEIGDKIYMYGVLVGKAQQHILKGEWITTFNVKHASNSFNLGQRNTAWQAPEVAEYKDKTFLGYHREDGSVGTGNYWVVLPMVFCENRNLEIMKAALVEDLGYGKKHKYQNYAQNLISLYKSGKTVEDILSVDIEESSTVNSERVFKNIDGVKFLNHDMGCGGTRQDAQALCGLLAGYITHPNVAGATVLSLGCQNAQYSMLQEEIEKERRFRWSTDIFLRTTTDWHRGGLGKFCYQTDFCRIDRSKQIGKKTSTIKQTHFGFGMWRLGWLFGNFRKSRNRLYFRSY